MSKESFESNLIKIPAKDVVDELYGKPPTKGEKDIAEFRKKKILKPERIKNQELSEQIKNWQNFYQETFKITPDLSDLEIPEKREGFNKLIIMAKGMTAQKLFDKCDELFKAYKNTEKDLDEITNSDRNAKEEVYAIWVRDGIESDEELKKYSFDRVKEEKLITETLEERLLQELEYFFRTKDRLDKESRTLCSGSSNYIGSVPNVSRYGDKLHICWDSAGVISDHWRPREVVAFIEDGK